MGARPLEMGMLAETAETAETARRAVQLLPLAVWVVAMVLQPVPLLLLLRTAQAVLLLQPAAATD